MKITVLIDNLKHPKLDLHTEHGLSVYFESDGLKYLLDVGASDRFISNAEMLGIDIADIDVLIVSHGHADHIGGLAAFVENNTKATIFLSSHIRSNTFYSTRRLQKRKISINDDVFSQHFNRFVFVTDDVEIKKGVTLVCHVPLQFPTPKGNKTLLVADDSGERLDDFKHEISVLVSTPKGNIVFTGCAHKGLLNILAASQQTNPLMPLIASVGGTHLLDGDENNCYETTQELEVIASHFSHQYPFAQLFTGHCSGTNAVHVFTQVLGEKCQTFYTGMTIEC